MSLHAQDHLETLFILDGYGRIVSTREPNPSPGPSFVLIRRADSVAWVLRSDMGEDRADKLARLAREELPTDDFRSPPKHWEDYMKLLGGEFEAGPAYEFPQPLALQTEAVRIEDVGRLEETFKGWTADELPERSPIMAIIDAGAPRSVCFCARSSDCAAEAGVETAPEYRGRGFAGRATTAWAAAIRASGRIPIYSTSWSNAASLEVARKLGLLACASYWSFDSAPVATANENV